MTKESSAAARTILFVQGAGHMREPDGSGHLADYLERELGTAYRVVAPEMPDADNPRYRPWRDAIERELRGIDGWLALIGHSFGGSVLLKYLAEPSVQRRIEGLFLVSVPWWGPEGWTYEEFAVPEDLAASLPRTRIFLSPSREDLEVPFAHFRVYEQQLPASVSRPLPGSDHSFVDGLPQLVDDVKSLPA